MKKKSKKFPAVKYDSPFVPLKKKGNTKKKRKLQPASLILEKRLPVFPIGQFFPFFFLPFFFDRKVWNMFCQRILDSGSYFPKWNFFPLLFKVIYFLFFSSTVEFDVDIQYREYEALLTYFLIRVCQRIDINVCMCMYFFSFNSEPVAHKDGQKISPEEWRRRQVSLCLLWEENAQENCLPSVSFLLFLPSIFISDARTSSWRTSSCQTLIDG